MNTVFQKGLKRVLEERGVNVTNMKRDDMVKALSEFRDFKEERSAVCMYLYRIMHYHCIVLPKVSILHQSIHLYKRCYLLGAICIFPSRISRSADTNQIADR